MPMPRSIEPDRQPRQTRQADQADKRLPVVAVNLLWQPILLEKGLKYGPSALIGGSLHPHHSQHVAAVSAGSDRSGNRSRMGQIDDLGTQYRLARRSTLAP